MVVHKCENDPNSDIMHDVHYYGANGPGATDSPSDAPPAYNEIYE